MLKAIYMFDLQLSSYGSDASYKQLHHLGLIDTEFAYIIRKSEVNLILSCNEKRGGS